MNTPDTKPLQIYPSMCARQLEDLRQMLSAIDDFGATALALSSNSAQGYSSFIDARDQIRELVRSTAMNYRLVSE